MQATTQSSRISPPRNPGAALLAGALILIASSASALEPAELQQLEQAQAEVRAVGGAMLIWTLDQPGEPPPFSGTVDVSTVPTITRAALETILVPEYIEAIPELDPWGNPYEYRFDPAWSGAAPFGGARSAGADGTFEGVVYTVGDTTTPAEDLVRWNGELVRQLGPPFLSLLDAQRMTVQDIVVVEQAVFEWVFTQTGPLMSPPADGTIDLGAYEPIAAADLRALLAPFLPRVPDNDRWGHPFDYYLDPDPPFEPPFFAVRSRGRDGVAEGEVYPVGTFPAIEFHRDTVEADNDLRFPDSFDELIFVDDFETGDARFWSAWSP
jgi:hypothetical protein